MIVFEAIGSSYKLPNTLVSPDTAESRACCLFTKEVSSSFEKGEERMI